MKKYIPFDTMDSLPTSKFFSREDAEKCVKILRKILMSEEKKINEINKILYGNKN